LRTNRKEISMKIVEDIKQIWLFHISEVAYGSQMRWMRLMNMLLSRLQMYCGMIFMRWYQHFQSYLQFIWHSLKPTLHLQFQLNLEIRYPCFSLHEQYFTLASYDKFQLSLQWLWKPSQEQNLKLKNNKNLAHFSSMKTNYHYCIRKDGLLF